MPTNLKTPIVGQKVPSLEHQQQTQKSFRAGQDQVLIHARSLTEATDANGAIN